jgi:hypothetical protein
LKEAKKIEAGRQNQGEYFCPECGKPFANVSSTESHLNNVYELHMKAWHAHEKDLAPKIT